jgi:DamX protein
MESSHPLEDRDMSYQPIATLEARLRDLEQRFTPPEFGAKAGGASDERLAALDAALESQADKLRDIEVALVGRIADVDDDRRRTATAIQRALETHREEMEENYRRRALITAIFVFLAFASSIAATTLGLLQFNAAGKAETAAEFSHIQDKVDRLSALDLTPLDARLNQIEESVAVLSGDLVTSAEERQTGETALANRLQGLEEAQGQVAAPLEKGLAELGEVVSRLSRTQEEVITNLAESVAEVDTLAKETAERQAADADLAKKMEDLAKNQEEIQKAQDRLGKDILLLRDSLANTLASAQPPPEQRTWTEESPAAAPPLEPEHQAKAEPEHQLEPRLQLEPQPEPKLEPIPDVVDGQITLVEHQYALQLISFNTAEDLHRFASRGDLPARIYYREESRRGKTWYAVFYSLYQDQAAAGEAMAALPAELTALKPLIRQLDPATHLQVLDRDP